MDAWYSLRAVTKQHRLLRKGMWMDMSVIRGQEQITWNFLETVPLDATRRLKGIFTAWEINSIFPHHTHTHHTFPVFGTNLVSRMRTGLGLVVLALIWVYWLMNLTSKEYGTNWKNWKAYWLKLRNTLFQQERMWWGKKLKFESCTMVSNTSHYLNIWQEITLVVCIFCGNVCGSTWAHPDSPMMAESCVAAVRLGPDKLLVAFQSQPLLTTERWRYLRIPKNRK